MEASHRAAVSLLEEQLLNAECRLARESEQSRSLEHRQAFNLLQHFDEQQKSNTDICSSGEPSAATLLQVLACHSMHPLVSALAKRWVPLARCASYLSNAAELFCAGWRIIWRPFPDAHPCSD